ncbi:MAG: type II toxin-antitoxin system VapC family toxin [Spirochaetales bacterium]|nr:type II toxin-antitoxin system VapC family toxin [Spirochaetales bacterium]
MNRRTEMQLSMDGISENVESEHDDKARIAELESLGFDSMDAVHLMCAEKAKVDVLLTTDDKFRKRGGIHSSKLKVRIENPVTWVQEVLE